MSEEDERRIEDIYARELQKEVSGLRKSIWQFGPFRELALNAARFVGQGLIAYFLFGLVYWLALNPEMWGGDQYYLVASEVIRLFFTTISVFIAVRVFEDSDIRTLGLKFDRLALGDFLAGFAIVTLVFAAETAVQLIFGWILVEQVAWQSRSVADIVWNLLIVLVIFTFVGWNEELLSRGYHLRVIAKGLNLPLGVILSAVYFSYMHHYNPDMTAIRYAFIFLFGLVIALAYLRTGRLWLAIGLHAAWDFLVVIFWGEPIGPLNLFHLVEVRYLVGPLLELSLDLVALIFLAFCIYLYTRRRKAEPLDWY